MDTLPTSNFSEINQSDIHRPVLKVMGLGGGGCNAIERMIELGLQGVEFIAANTDHQALVSNSASIKIQLGPRTTRGLGAGGDPAIGKVAAEESSREIAAALAGADMVFLTAGMGGGTGTGAIPIAAEIARSVGAVTIAIVTTPFSFEMGRRTISATEGLKRLRKQTNTLIAIPNDRLLYVSPRNLSLETAFRLADDVLRQSVQGISELITVPGLINVDFAHIRRLIQLGGGALMSIGQGRGENKARKAIDTALRHPLLETVSFENAAGIIANFTCGQDLSLGEVEEALSYLQENAGGNTEIVLGVIQDEMMEDKVQVILVITGLGGTSLEDALSGIKKPEAEPTLVMSSQSSIPSKEPVTQPSPKVVAQPVKQSISQAPSLETFLQAADINSEAAIASANLDLPAFLRRRTRISSQVQ